MMEFELNETMDDLVGSCTSYGHQGNESDVSTTMSSGGEVELNSSVSYNQPFSTISPKFVMKAFFVDGDMVVDAPGFNKSQIESVKKQLKKCKSSKNSLEDELSRNQQIDVFLNKYSNFHFNDVPVKDLRHMIPLLLAEVYSNLFGQYSKKVKGLWEKKPDDWLNSIPFVDPNNKIKTGLPPHCKPKKELLLIMLDYLARRYSASHTKAERSSSATATSTSNPLMTYAEQDTSLPLGSASLTSDVFSTENVLVLGSGEQELRLAEQSLYTIDGQLYYFNSGSNELFAMNSGQTLESAAIFTTASQVVEDGNQGVISLTEDEQGNNGSTSLGQNMRFRNVSNDFPVDMSSKMKVEGKERLVTRPLQVQDNEEDITCDWNPIEEQIQRTMKKLKYLKKLAILPRDDIGTLEIYHDLLQKLKERGVSDYDVLLLENAHHLETAIDIAKMKSELTPEWRKKLHDYYEPVKKLLVKADNSDPFDDVGVKRFATTEAEFFETSDISLQNLNIEARDDKVLDLYSMQDFELRETVAYTNAWDSDCLEKNTFEKVEQQKTGNTCDNYPVNLTAQECIDIMQFMLPEEHCTKYVTPDKFLSSDEISQFLSPEQMPDNKIEAVADTCIQLHTSIEESNTAHTIPVMCYESMESKPRAGSWRKSSAVNKQINSLTKECLISANLNSPSAEISNTLAEMTLKQQNEHPSILAKILTEPQAHVQKAGEKRKPFDKEMEVDECYNVESWMSLPNAVYRSPPIPTMVTEIEDCNDSSFKPTRKRMKQSYERPARKN